MFTLVTREMVEEFISEANAEDWGVQAISRMKDNVDDLVQFLNEQLVPEFDSLVEDFAYNINEDDCE